MSRSFKHTTLHHLAGRRRTRRVTSMLVLLFSLHGMKTPAAHGQSSGTWNKRGQDAEVRENYDAAFEAFRQAHLKSPKDLRYTTRLERVRGLASAQHVDRGRTLRQNGDFSGAIKEFMRAAEIDPSNQVPQQEIEITQREQPAAPAPTGGAAGLDQMAQQGALQRSLASIAGPVELQPVSNDPITLNMVEDVKVIYQSIGKLAGLNVLFDPDYSSKRIPVDLKLVSLSDALRIVGTIAGTFYKPITPNTIFVAQNTRTKRTDLDELSVQTFYLSNSSQANDGNEVQTAIRNLLDPSTKIYYVPSQNALVLRATADQLMLAQKIINDLDRARPEVVVDVAVLEVNRDKVRTLGITLPTSFGLTPQASATTSTTGTTTATGTGTTTTGSTTSSLNLNNLAHLNATNFAVSVSGGTLNALLTDSDTRILQNPRIRASDGQRATLKIGSKIPIATGSFSSTLSTTASLGVQTQFTYLDVGVNIDLTPTVHYDREVTLKMKIEVSSQTGTVPLSGGVTEPIIGQNVTEQVVQLKDGEPSVLAGIITTTNNKTVNGTPGLGEIPFFKYFFSTQSKEVARNEIVFVLIPHIVRESILTRINTSPIDTGTGQSIELRRENKPARGVLPGNLRSDEDGDDTVQPRPASTTTGSTTTAASAATAIVAGNTPGRAALAASAATTPAPGTGGAGGGLPIRFGVMPPLVPQLVGSTFQVAVTLANARDVYSVPMQLQFDPKLLQLVNVDSGDFLARGNQAVSLVHRDEGNGLVTISTSRPPNTPGVTGQGSVCTLTFRALAAGDSNLALVKVGAKDSNQASLPAIGSQATVHIQ